MGNKHSQGIVGDPRLIATPGPYPNGPEDSKSWRKYDYVVVGGGSAGCVLASRLSEDRNTTVLLIDAGKTHEGDVPTRIPLGYMNIWGTGRDWNFGTVPQKSLGNREIHWPRGKVLGGTSATNVSVYHRCPPESFDEWVSFGALGWSYSDLQPYFLKAEHYTATSKHARVDTAEHGSDGPWQTRSPSETSQLDDYMVEACRSVGMKYIDDINARQGSLGVTRFIGTIDRRGRRSSTATAYMTDDVLDRPNLTIGIGMSVEKVLFSTPSNANEKPRAIGVQMAVPSDTTHFCVAATREVILCGGTIGTPQILMLSGIGLAGDLQSLNIPVVRNLPAVGRNLVDHVSTGPLMFRSKSALTYDYLHGVFSETFAMFKWLTFGSGPLSSMGITSAAFVRSTDSALPFGAHPPAVDDDTSNPAVPDMQLVWLPITPASDNLETRNTNSVTLSAVLLNPQSRGRIMLKSNSIWDQPLVDPNYLSTDNDINILVRGVRLLMHIARTQPVASKLLFKASASTDPSNPWWAGESDPDKITDDEIRDRLRRNAQSAWNPVSTARMGRAPGDSVVDPELRVHGIAALRVVDASVFPAQLAGDSCAVVVAMAEKAADMIKSASRTL